MFSLRATNRAILPVLWRTPYTRASDIVDKTDVRPKIGSKTAALSLAGPREIGGTACHRASGANLPDRQPGPHVPAIQDWNSPSPEFPLPRVSRVRARHPTSFSERRRR